MRWFVALVTFAACGRVQFDPLSDGGHGDAENRAFAQLAYLKASNAGAAGASDEFGYSVAMSGDTLVVGARMEDSNGSSPADESEPRSGAVYVFERSGSTWVEQAYIKAPGGDPDDRFGGAVAIDGDTLVVGARFEGCSCRGVSTSPGSDNLALDSGAAYVFVRSGSTWTLQAYLKSSVSDPDDNFGYDVAVDGDTIAVAALQDDGPTNTQPDRGAVFVFTRSGTVWTEQAALYGSSTPASALFGRSIALQGDRLVAGAYREGGGAVYTYDRLGTIWTETQRVLASNSEAGDGFGFSVALTGTTLAVGARGESGGTTGIGGNQLDNTKPAAGAVYIFDYTGSWSQSAYIKASNADPDDQFGFDVALDGQQLAVSAIAEKSLATGIDGDQADNSSTIPIPQPAQPSGPGAVYLFERLDGTWAQRAYIKASNTVNDDDQTSTPRTGNQFGYAVMLSGGRLAVGAIYEDSAGIGVGGAETQPGVGADGPAENSGAVYFFE